MNIHVSHRWTNPSRLLTGRLCRRNATNIDMDNLRILLRNVNGLFSRKLELEVFLHHEKIDVALITETHFAARYSFSSTRDYNVTHSFHPTGKAPGGATVFIKKSRSYTLDITHSATHFQRCAVRLPVEGKTLALASVY